MRVSFWDPAHCTRSTGSSISVFVLGFQFALRQILIIWYPCDWQTAPEPGLQLHCVLLGVGRVFFAGSCLSHFGGEL